MVSLGETNNLFKSYDDDLKTMIKLKHSLYGSSFKEFETFVAIYCMPVSQLTVLKISNMVVHGYGLFVKLTKMGYMYIKSKNIVYLGVERGIHLKRCR